LRRLADRCEAIRFYGYLANEDMQQLLSDSDIAVVPMFPDSFVAVPYKLADYTAAGLPMICCLTGETQQMIERYAAGTMYAAGDVEDFKRVMLGYLHKRSRITQESMASARIARENFMMDTIYVRFVQFLTDLVNQ
jgi:glycosyltransferase involved in cell wall biosynthesis